MIAAQHLVSPVSLAHTPGAMSAPDLSDEELMLRYQAGDAEAFTFLYQRHKGGVYRYLLRQCGIAGAAEEMMQDIWLNIVRTRAQYTPSAKFATYLYCLAHNRLIDHYRSQGKVVWFNGQDEDDDPFDGIAASAIEQPEVRAMAQEIGKRLNEAIAQLPLVQREAFLLQQESGLSVEEIAQLTQVTFETAKSRLRYASAKLREQLKDLL